MTKLFKHIILTLLVQLTLMGTPLGLQAQVDPNIEWKEIETRHAYWIFDAKHQEVAEYYILQFEQAKQEVFPLFKEGSRKLTILLLDNTDQANGSAQVSPHPIINLFMVRPLSGSSIGEFKDPVHELLVHEYTHILNMEPVHGLMSPLPWIFGSVAHPNMILPRWYTEGLAVYTESLISENGGRLNSQYLEGLARNLTLHKKWDEFPLSDLNDFHRDWLGGSRAYLFGGILWDSIARQAGTESVYKFNQSYSRRLPYLINGVIEEHLGVSYEEQLTRAYTYWEKQTAEQIKIISQAKQMDGEKISHKQGQRLSAPSISPNGKWMVFLSRNNEGEQKVYLKARTQGLGFTNTRQQIVTEELTSLSAKEITGQAQTQTLSWRPDSSGFVYEKLGRHQLFYRYFDLYFYNIKTEKSERLTHGLRAHHSCFSQDGDFLFFLTNTPGSKKIVKMDWNSRKTETFYQAAIGDDLRHLACPSNQSLLFIEHHAGDKPHIARLNLKTSQKTIAFSKYPVKFLKTSKRGALLTSDQSGVDNLYLLNKNNKNSPQALTNSLTRVLNGDLDPIDGSLYYNQLTIDGPQIFRLTANEWQSLPHTPPQVKPVLAFTEKTKNQGRKRKPNQASTNKPSYPVSEFSPWRYLYPNYWIPFLYLVDGGTLFQAITSAGDPLGINTLSLIGQWDTLTKKPGVTASYINRSWPINIGLGVSDFYTYFYPTDDSLHYSNASALLSSRLAFLDYTRLMLKWNYSTLDSPVGLFTRQGPQVEVSYNSMNQTVVRPNSDISQNEGWRFQLGHKNYLSRLSSVNYDETYAHLGTFWSSFTPKRHVLYLGLNGSYADRLNNGFFATSTLAGPFLNPQLINTNFLQRGYPTGVFIARNIANLNAEYRFPIFDIYGGWTTPPLFFKNLQGSFVFDATSFDGRYSSVSGGNQVAEFGRWFTGYGLELENKVNMGFHVPVSFTLGLYYGQEQESFGGFTTFFNIRL